MPYVLKKHRDMLRPRTGASAATPGELNYQISQLVKDYLALRPVTYETYNSVIGVLESLKLEVYRRMVAPYEEVKISENGDVF